jgi:serine/threonine-protein kinase RCK2
LYSAPVGQAPQHQAPQSVPQAHAKQTGELNEAAARIVAEEREARGRLPRYPGLERFKLLDKMGEYVQYMIMLTDSGAFSTVYKAQNRDTGQLVAIKVVRKHELNASQVIPFATPFIFIYTS